MNREEWDTRSGGASDESGERPLPKRVRMLRIDNDHARTTRAKRRGRAIPGQPDGMHEKAARRKTGDSTGTILDQRARHRRRTKMSKEALPHAIEAATEADRRGAGSSGALKGKTRAELRDMTRGRDRSGRSKMMKAGLMAALSAGRARLYAGAGGV